MLGSEPTTTNDEPNQPEKMTFQKKRDEYTVEIRKKKRDDLLTKRRIKNLEIDQQIQEGHATSASHNLAGDVELQKLIDGFLKKVYTMEEFQELVQGTHSTSKAQQHYGVIGLRKLLSGEGQLPIQLVIDANVVPRLIQFMQDDTEPHLQLEAAWALTNVASGTSTQTQTIIDKGGIQCFINLLKSNRMILAEQAIWALGNIAGDSPAFRDMILQWGGLTALLEVVNTTQSKLIIKHGTWALSNLCRGKPLPDLRLCEAALPTMAQVVIAEKEVEVVGDAMWALSYLSRGDSNVQTTIETGVIPSLIKYLQTSYLQLIVPCLRTLGNIVTGNESQTNAVLQHADFLPSVFPLVLHKKKTLRREACWVLSNVTAGTLAQAQTIVCVPDYINAIRQLITGDSEDIKQEAAWILANATKNSDPETIAKMIDLGVMDSFISLLGSTEAKTIQIALEAIYQILNWGADLAARDKTYENQFVLALEQKGGVPIIEDLQTHPSNEVYNKASKILQNHFETENPFK